MLKRQKKTCEHRIEVTSKVKFYYVGWHKVLEKIGKGEFGDVMLGIYQVRSQLLFGREYYHCTADLLFDWFGIICMTTDIFLFLFAKQTNPNQSNRSTVQ